MYSTPAEILTHLEAGFRASSTRLHAVGQDLRGTLQRGREFAALHGPGPGTEGRAALDAAWGRVEASLDRLQSLAARLEDAPRQADIEDALQAWEELEAERARLEAALTAVRDLAAPLGAPARQAWNGLARAFEDQLAMLLASASTLRLRLELQDGRSPEEVDAFVRDVLAELRERPMPQTVDASFYQLAYLKAAIEIAHEKQQSLGFPRVIKTLFTWYENPEERVRRQLHLPID